MAASCDSALEKSISQPSAEKRQNLEDLLGVEDAYKCLNDFIINDTNNAGNDQQHVEYNAEEIEKIKKQLEGLGEEGEGEEMETEGLSNGESKFSSQVPLSQEQEANMNQIYSSFELAMKNPVDFVQTIDKAFFNQLGPIEFTAPPRPPKSQYLFDPNSPPPPVPPRKKKPSGGGGGFLKFFGSGGKGKRSPTKSKNVVASIASQNGPMGSTHQGNVQPAANINSSSVGQNMNVPNTSNSTGLENLSLPQAKPTLSYVNASQIQTNTNVTKTAPVEPVKVEPAATEERNDSCVGIGEIYDLYVGDAPPRAEIDEYYADVVNNN